MRNLLNNWNPINTIENIVIFAAAILLMNWFVVKPLNEKLERMENKIIELAMQPKYNINNDLGKIKAKDGSDIVLDLDNTMNTQNLETINPDTIPQQKTTWWNKIFKGKK